MIFEAERALVAEYGRRMIADGLAVGTAGNISARLPAGDLIAITPSGAGYRAMSAAGVCVLRTDGRAVDGDLVP